MACQNRRTGRDLEGRLPSSETAQAFPYRETTMYDGARRFPGIIVELQRPLPGKEQ